MNRGFAFILLLAIVLGGVFVATNTDISTLLNTTDSPILFSYDGVGVSLATFCWAMLLIGSWVTLTILGYTIHPYLGELILRIGVYVIMKRIDKNFKITPDRQGGGGRGPLRVG